MFEWNDKEGKMELAHVQVIQTSVQTKINNIVLLLIIDIFETDSWMGVSIKSQIMTPNITNIIQELKSRISKKGFTILLDF